MTPDQMRDFARDYILESASHADMVSIHELAEPDELTDDEASHIIDLINSSQIEITWPDE